MNRQRCGECGRPMLPLSAHPIGFVSSCTANDDAIGRVWRMWCPDCEDGRIIIEGRRHGTGRTYDAGCRCDECVEFMRRKNAENAKKAAGRA